MKYIKDRVCNPENSYSIKSLHLSREDCYKSKGEWKNYGTFFGDLLGLRELFKDDVVLYGAYDKFDSFLKK